MANFFDDMINHAHTETFEFTNDELIAMLRALYWYEDKLTNMQRATEKENQEWDQVVYLRQRLGNILLKEAYL